MICWTYVRNCGDTPYNGAQRGLSTVVELYVVEAYVNGERRRYVGIAQDAADRIHRIKLGKSASFLRAKGAKRPGEVGTISITRFPSREEALLAELLDVCRQHAAGFLVRGGPFSNVKLTPEQRDELRGVARLVAHSDDPTEALAEAKSEVKRVRCHVDDTCFHCESGEHYISKPAATSGKRLFKAWARVCLLLFLRCFSRCRSVLLPWALKWLGRTVQA